MSTRAPARPPKRARAIVGATVGHTIEFFDFTVYGFLAVHIGATFFPSDDPTAELLSSFAVFGLAFLARPLGGFVLGPLADRIGRKRVLVLVLTVMAACSVGIGVLPGYDSWGIAAPLVLVALRTLQGFSAGGEYGSGSAFLLEYAGRNRRAFGISWLTFGTTAGLMLGITVVTALTATLGDDTMAEWGWRIPFLLAAPLAAIALYIRAKLEETPDFQAMSETGTLSRSPGREVLSRGRRLALIIGIGAMHATCFYAVFTYMPTYIGTVNDYGSTFSLISTMCAGAATMVTLPLVATVSDRIGRRPVLLFGSIGFAVIVFPVFSAITLGNPALALLSQLLLGVFTAIYLSASAATMPELFPASIRSSGVSIGFNIPAAVFGGSAPFVATFLIQQTDWTPSPSIYLLLTAICGAVASFLLTGKDLHGDDLVDDEKPATPTTVEEPARVPDPIH